MFDFDTIQQRKLWESESGDPLGEHQRPPETITHRFSGLLRTADILTQKIVVPDVQLLDGSLFLHHGPDKVRSMLAKSVHEQLDIVVMGRHSSMAECLRRMLLGSRPAETLAVFEFSSMAVFGLDPRELAGKVSHRSNARLRDCSPHDVAFVVAAEFQAAAERVAHVDEPTGVFQAMAERWNAWIEASRTELEPIVVWENQRFNLDSALAARQLPHSIASGVAEDGFLARVVDEVMHIKGRSTLLSRLSAVESDLTQDSARLLDAWWSSAYFDALARQHRCSWIRLKNSPSEAATMAATNADDMMSVQFDGSLTEIFSGMPEATFAAAKYAARTAISRWSDEPQRRNADGLAFTFIKYSEVLDRQQTMHSIVLRIILTFIPAILGILINQFFSTTAGFFAVIISAGGILLAAPIEDFMELYGLRRKNMESVITIPGRIL